MERGLMWLPLLGLFIWLAYAGWNEYQKLEAYKVWAQQFERAKFDVLAVLGQRGDRLVWGKPTRRGLIDERSLNLREVEALTLLVNDQPVDLANPPERGRTVALEFRYPADPQTGDKKPADRIPFTQVELAARWGVALQQVQQQLS
jgi:hypothetical protein